MLFRTANFDELSRVLELYRSVLNSQFTTWNLDYPGEEDIQSDYAHGCLYVLMEGNTLVGAISEISENELGEYPFWKIKENTAEIARVVVSPAYQGKGLSKYLVLELEKIFYKRGIKAVHLLAAVGNVPAQCCYRSCGYQILGRVEMYDNEYYACEKAL